jgi:hypothetical protein
MALSKLLFCVLLRGAAAAEQALFGPQLGSVHTGLHEDAVAASDSDVNKKCNSNSVRELNRNPVMFGNTAAGTAIAAETATMMNMILIAMVVTVVVLVLADMK